ncbi:hypothetical protein DEU56DRAFT_396618 [Suillus clintonianus]|uniref:uncharacterized protein n=1 Tax=Suillus clintonianus TaxID=1904413 RepID=UPI001B8748F2|nr:uncharacterized protein DEU56DRAFT_396618 [Suillus clintonianus]KAG2135301.1 hypothetical protein DEU56DRAFT_396618 [Suillus clintonianus]
MMSAHGVLQRLFGTVRSRWTRLSEALRGPIRAIGAFAWRSLQQSFTALHNGLRSLVLRSSRKVVDSEGQPLDQNLDTLAENECTLALYLPDIPTAGLEAPSIKWLLETSTDPEVFLTAASLVPHVDWPLDLDVSDMLPQLLYNFASCVDIQRQIVPSLKDKASVCIMALSHLYCGRVLQAHPNHGEILGQRERDYNVFREMRWMNLGTADKTVLSTTMNLCPPIDDDPACSIYLRRFEDPISVLEWLSHSLPYHFVIGRGNEGVEELAIAVISRLLSSPSTPSNQIVANCILLAGVMIGVRFDKKDIARIDKSAALPELAQPLVTQFQKVLWAWDGGDVDTDSTGVTRQAWKLLDVICRILEPARAYYYTPPSQTMQNLDVCRKIYSQARSSERSYPWEFLGDLQNALHFTLTAAHISCDPARLWYARFWQDDSHPPEDFDWLVDCLYYIHPHNQEPAYDILLLLHGLGARCSPTKQHMFIGSLIACMGGWMPNSLRHAALRAVHSVRKEMALIHAIDDASFRDMVLTELSPAILTAVCPGPGATPTDDGSDRIFDRRRDACYLELVFALARNSDWHSHLSGDHHIDQCISMIAGHRLIPHAFYLAGILLRIAPEQWSPTSLDSITEQQWWYMLSSAWMNAYDTIDDIHCFEFLPDLVQGTKRYMRVAETFELQMLIRYVDDIVEKLERRDSEQEGRGEQGQGVAVAVKELRTVVSDMLERMVKSDEVVST